VFGAGTFYVLRLMAKPPRAGGGDEEECGPSRAAGIVPGPAMAGRHRTHPAE